MLENTSYALLEAASDNGEFETIFLALTLYRIGEAFLRLPFLETREAKEEDYDSTESVTTKFDKGDEKVEEQQFDWRNALEKAKTTVTGTLCSCFFNLRKARGYRQLTDKTNYEVNHYTNIVNEVRILNERYQEIMAEYDDLREKLLIIKENYESQQLGVPHNIQETIMDMHAEELDYDPTLTLEERLVRMRSHQQKYIEKFEKNKAAAIPLIERHSTLFSAYILPQSSV